MLSPSCEVVVRLTDDKIPYHTILQMGNAGMSASFRGYALALQPPFWHRCIAAWFARSETGKENLVSFRYGKAGRIICSIILALFFCT